MNKKEDQMKHGFYSSKKLAGRVDQVKELGMTQMNLDHLRSGG